MKKYLMVCLGNICRSPMAEGILTNKLKEKGIEAQVDSCGTSDYHIDESPDPRAREKAKEKGLDIDHLRGRQFVTADFDRFDEIFVMDKSNYENVLALAEREEQRQKVKMILSELDDKEVEEVPDPYFGMEDGFEIVYNLLDRACDKIVARTR
ncbi:low molecular weight protein-tyrosine-phosphatase [Halocola ammonii]